MGKILEKITKFMGFWDKNVEKWAAQEKFGEFFYF